MQLANSSTMFNEADRTVLLLGETLKLQQDD